MHKQIFQEGIENVQLMSNLEW